jgi:hypothetical protein
MRSLEGEKNRIEALPKGKKHWRWNNNPSILTLHRRIHRRHGKAKWHNYSDCGKPAVDWSNDKKEYSDNIEDYSPRCRSCHIKKDFTNERREKIRKADLNKKRNSLGRFI